MTKTRKVDAPLGLCVRQSIPKGPSNKTQIPCKHFDFPAPPCWINPMNRIIYFSASAADILHNSLLLWPLISIDFTMALRDSEVSVCIRMCANIHWLCLALKSDINTTVACNNSERNFSNSTLKPLKRLIAKANLQHVQILPEEWIVIEYGNECDLIECNKLSELVSYFSRSLRSMIQFSVNL